MKQKRKLKNGYRLSNKRLLIVAIGLLVILMLAVANIAYIVNYPTRVAQSKVAQLTATSMIATNNQIMHFISMTETQAAMPISTVEAP